MGRRVELGDLKAAMDSGVPAPRAVVKEALEPVAPVATVEAEPEPVATPTRRAATKRSVATTAPEPVVEVATAKRDRPPVRTTVDLPHEDHRAFLKWCADAADELGRPRVHGQEVMRVLVRRLMADERLARQITGDLKKHAGKLSSKY